VSNFHERGTVRRKRASNDIVDSVSEKPSNGFDRHHNLPPPPHIVYLVRRESCCWFCWDKRLTRLANIAIRETFYFY